MKTRIRRWGNSLALRIPRPFAEESGLSENTMVELTLEGRKLVISPATRTALEALLSRVTDDNLHGEIDFGPQVGDEAW